MRNLTSFDLSREGFAPKERNDCAVRALMAMENVPYAVAWYTVNEVARRKSRCGTPTLKLHAWLDTRYERITDLTGQSVAIALEREKGRIVISISQHIFCAENGVQISDDGNWYNSKLIHAAWRKRPAGLLTNGS